MNQGSLWATWMHPISCLKYTCLRKSLYFMCVKRRKKKRLEIQCCAQDTFHLNGWVAYIEQQRQQQQHTHNVKLECFSSSLPNRIYIEKWIEFNISFDFTLFRNFVNRPNRYKRQNIFIYVFRGRAWKCRKKILHRTFITMDIVWKCRPTPCVHFGALLSIFGEHELSILFFQYIFSLFRRKCWNITC